MEYVKIYEYIRKRDLKERKESNVESYVPGFRLVMLPIARPRISCLTVWTDFTVLITKTLNLGKMHILAWPKLIALAIGYNGQIFEPVKYKTNYSLTLLLVFCILFTAVINSISCVLGKPTS